MILVADLIACRLDSFMSAVACRPAWSLGYSEAVEWFLVWLL